MRLIITLTLSFLAYHLNAQEVPGLQDQIVDSTFYQPVYHYRSTGLSYRTSRDEALSPLLFQGAGLTFSGSSWKYKDKWLWQSGLATQVHLLQNEPASSLLVDVGFDYHLSALRELSSFRKDQWRFWIGPEASMLLNFRMHTRNVNNMASYDWATALGTTAMVSNQFKLFGRTFALSNQFRLPLFFLYARPPYAWSVPPAIYEKQEGSWKEAFQLGTLNDILLMSNQLNIDFFLPKRRKGTLIQKMAYRLTYSWSFFQVTSENKVQIGAQGLSLSRIITF